MYLRINNCGDGFGSATLVANLALRRSDLKFRLDNDGTSRVLHEYSPAHSRRSGCTQHDEALALALLVWVV